MQLPLPPTDSLYKFLALVGLVVVLTSLIGPGYMMYGLDQKIVTAERESQTIAIRTERANNKATQAKRSASHIDSISKMMSIRPKTDSLREMEILLKGFEEANNTLSALDEANVEVKEQMLLATSKMRELDVLLKWLNYAIGAMFFGTIVGGVLIIFGFDLWFKRVQTPLDQLAQMQVTLLNSPTDIRSRLKLIRHSRS